MTLDTNLFEGVKAFLDELDQVGGRHLDAIALVQGLWFTLDRDGAWECDLAQDEHGRRWVRRAEVEGARFRLCIELEPEGL